MYLFIWILLPQNVINNYISIHKYIFIYIFIHKYKYIYIYKQISTYVYIIWFKNLINL